jgi:4-amino-4-deoxy-L-arabinose transferase-like glycosyltransferase
VKNNTIKKIYSLLLVIAIAVIIWGFFSYRILDTPPGLTTDEAAFGYNAALLSKTAHDENGRFMPFFVLSINGADWRQPVSQYFITAVFKIFGPSLPALRLSTVAILVFSTFLTYFWLSKVINKKAGIISALIFLTIPIVMIQTHMALDNIFPIPFTLLWLIFLWYFSKTKSLKYLVLAGVSLGINFYTYKAMRATVPVWCLLTIVFLFCDLQGKYSKKDLLIYIKRAFAFALGTLPFFAIIPFLDFKYAGAVFDSHGFNWSSIYNFLYPYLSSFDPSFLFIKGDDTVYHSTGIHGMLLLASLPVFLIGLYQGIRKRGIWIFFIAAMFTSPLLFGFVDSVHRASRLLAFIPLYVALATLGILTISELKNKTLSRILIIATVVSFSWNYIDFINYYWFTYPKFARTYFLPPNTVGDAYLYLSKIAKKNGLTPYIANGTFASDGYTGLFLEASYFDSPLTSWEAEHSLPPKSIVMAKLAHQPKLKTVGTPINEYYFFINEGETIIGQ